MSSGKRGKHRHRCRMGAGHLDHESAFDLVPGLAPSMKAKLAFTAVSEIPLATDTSRHRRRGDRMKGCDGPLEASECQTAV